MKKKVICILVMTLLVTTVLSLVVPGTKVNNGQKDSIELSSVITYDDQPPYNHSTLSTSDGSIRDDELADLICSKIPKNETGVPQVKDVKIMCAQCFGGGMLDDFERVFGPGGACEGVPWVFGSSCRHNETAEGWSDGTYTDKGFGSCWTDALAGKKCSPTNDKPSAIRDRTGVTGDNVKKDFERARDNDDSGPNHDNTEHPQVATGNGGKNINWTGAKYHRALVFGGSQTDQRHHNNVDNVEEALKGVWTDENKRNITKIDGGNTSVLKNAINKTCEGLNSSTQLVLYFDDHGDTHFNISEFLEWITKTIYEWFDVDFTLHSGWVAGLTGNYMQGEDPAPYLELGLVEPIVGDDWDILLNDVSIPLPSGTLYGRLELPVDWTSIQTGDNTLEIIGYSGDPMVLNGLELSSGPINEVEKEASENSPPNKPNLPSGPTSGASNTEYTYTTSTTDPNGDKISYLFDWGDGSDSGWIDPISSGQTASASHKWMEKGDYQIKVKARDIPSFEESEWSDPLSVSMPKSKPYINIPFLRFLENFFEKFSNVLPIFSILQLLL